MGYMLLWSVTSAWVDLTAVRRYAFHHALLSGLFGLLHSPQYSNMYDSVRSSLAFLIRVWPCLHFYTEAVALLYVHCSNHDSPTFTVIIPFSPVTSCDQLPVTACTVNPVVLALLDCFSLFVDFFGELIATSSTIFLDWHLFIHVFYVCLVCLLRSWLACVL